MASNSHAASAPYSTCWNAPGTKAAETTHRDIPAGSARPSCHKVCSITQDEPMPGPVQQQGTRPRSRRPGRVISGQLGRLAIAWHRAFCNRMHSDGSPPGGCQMRSADQRWRGSLAWTVAAALVLAGLAVGLGFRTVVGWLAAAVLAGLAATIAGLVQTTAKKGLAAGKELLTGTSPPLTISVEYWQQPFRFVDDPGQFDPGRLMRCGIVVLLIQATANQAVILKRIRVIIDSRDPGTYIPADPSHEPLPLRKFLVDLD